MQKLNINQWDEAERPRERLMAKGAEALSTAELLAILIGSGNADESAVGLMRRVLADCGGSLQTLSRMRLDELLAYKGVGPAKAVTIMAACELGRRRATESVVSCPMTSSQVIADYFRPRLQDLSHEECHVMLLRTNMEIIDTCLVSKGGLTASSVDIRLVLQKAIVQGATSIVLCHNHPSGSVRPSKEDMTLTARLSAACSMLDISLMDHIIVSCQGYYSFRDEGQL